jgi:hypothetical protein
MSPHIPGQSIILPQLHFNSSGISWESAATECGQDGLKCACFHERAKSQHQSFILIDITQQASLMEQ